jgi:hypothetical protein
MSNTETFSFFYDKQKSFTIGRMAAPKQVSHQAFSNPFKANQGYSNLFAIQGFLEKKRLFIFWELIGLVGSKPYRLKTNRFKAMQGIKCKTVDTPPNMP